MAKLLIIATDIDDVLSDHGLSFVNFSNKRRATSLTDDYDEHWAQMWQTDKNRGLAYFSKK